jgi:hypothetical protein
MLLGNSVLYGSCIVSAESSISLSLFSSSPKPLRIEGSVGRYWNAIILGRRTSLFFGLIGNDMAVVGIGGPLTPRRSSGSSSPNSKSPSIEALIVP